MARQPRLWGLLVLGLLACSATARAQGPTVAQILNYRPRMDDVVYTIPTPEEIAQCKVEAIKNAKGQKIGWAVVDGQHQTLRRFFDTNGDNKIDVWSYYKDGIEVYREIDTKGSERPNQYRWLNDGGMKWGVDYSGRGKIDYWQMISADEVGQEIFQALITNNFERLQALFISEKEMSDIHLSATETARIKDQLAKAQTRFRETAAKLRPGSKFVRVESAPPMCVPGDTLGMDTDLIHYTSRPILYEVGGTGKSTLDWVQSGEMIQVGLRWRLVAGPGDAPVPVNQGGGEQLPPEAQKIQQQISKLDETTQPIVQPKNKAQVQPLLERVALIDRLLPLLPPAQRENWIRQMLDNLSTAAVVDDLSMKRLGQLKAQLVKAMPGSNLAAHSVYCELCAQYLPAISNGDAKAQTGWAQGLTALVQAYPNTEITPEALQQLGIASEFSGKDDDAKRWYTQLYTSFPTHAHADKAKGSVRRIDAVGQPMELTSPLLSRSGTFSISQLRGKLVAVYYWTSYCTGCQRDFAVMKQLATSKGLEMVCVNLDDDPAAAVRYLASNPVPGIHLYEADKSGAGGLNGPLATHYGINSLPTLFLIGRDGKVLSRRIEVGELEEAIKKAP